MVHMNQEASMDMEITPARGSEESLTAAVLSKYQLAGQICSAALRHVIQGIQPGVRVSDLCVEGDRKVIELCASAPTFKKVKKGLSHPTSVSLNEVVQHDAPRPESDDITLDWSQRSLAPERRCQVGDVVKVEVGVHVDGHLCVAGHTTVVCVDPTLVLMGPPANALMAAQCMSELAWRLVRPGVLSNQFHEEMLFLAQSFRCGLVQGTYMTKVKQYVTDGGKDIFWAPDADLNQKNVPFAFDVNEVYDVALYVASLPESLNAVDQETYLIQGVPTRESDAPVSIYQRDVRVRHPLRTTVARKALAHIQSEQAALPFHADALPSSLRLGLRECVNAGVLQPFPVKACPRGSVVAVSRFTLAILPSGEVRRFTDPMLDVFPRVQPQYPIPTDYAPILAVDPSQIHSAVPLPLHTGPLMTRTVLGRSDKKKDGMEID